MHITIIGLGLIGGSLARDLRANGFATQLTGVDSTPLHREQALSLGLVDEIRPLPEAVAAADMVVLAVPVKSIITLLHEVLNWLRPDAVVTDMGSTKDEIARNLASHPRRRQLVLAHPMAGTEYSGPTAAVSNLFQGKAAIICNAHESDPEAVRRVERLFKSLFMRILHMEARDHDVHAAFVSHISHITSFVLALTVLEKEKSEANIFNLASGGFASTVRLAKSSPRMWNDVYEQNTEAILEVLDSYLAKMKVFRDHIAGREFQQTYQLMEEANQIGRILS
ncbi:MAG: prephenate dehydrogenase [Bacteroidia bacterium]|nr:prephenate dehydrogenase [Bacteroidia bacterium]